MLDAYDQNLHLINDRGVGVHIHDNKRRKNKLKEIIYFVTLGLKLQRPKFEKEILLTKSSV